MHPITGGLCSICGERLFSPHALSVNQDDGGPRCGLCSRVEPPFARAVAYGSFDGGLRELIHLLKYALVLPAANVLGRMLAEATADLDFNLASGPVLVVPVPLHRKRLRQREFNHAELIARAAIKIAAAPDRFSVSSSVLERKRETSSQTGLTSSQRRENVRGAFAVSRPDILKGREVLVVDDVYTTGATVSECARVLRRGGASRVWVATVARTLKAQEQQVEIQLPDDKTEVEAELANENVVAGAATG
jgi:ComF family protein